MSAAVNDQGLEAWRTFVRAHAAALKRLEAEMQAEVGLSLACYDVLLHLARAPRRKLRMQELADRVLLTQSGVSRLVDRLEAAGLVQREASSSDRRVTYAGLTEAGRRVMRAAARVHLRGVGEHFVQHLTPDELDVLQGALGRVLQAADTPAVSGGRSPQAPPRAARR